ncbi:hypothetical protein Q3G72_000509 [Acer saccharum]|nr:hypothetical protein Q3G72_000509 [Acer saccharum]
MEAATVDPPLIKNKPGRPKLVRKRELHEKPKASRSGSVICTKCKNPGHNKRTCKAVITFESNKKRAAKDANKSSTNARVEVGASSSQPPTQVQTQLQSQVTMGENDTFPKIYNNKEAKVKWIAFKFEKLVKSNPSIDVKVIGDLLRENYKVSVDMHKLYRATHRALQELAKKHANYFGYLRRCNHITNNMTEAFNSMLGTHRATSYLNLLEFIRRMVMRKFNERKEECTGCRSVLPPRVHTKILKHGRESRSLKMIAVGNMEYELLGASEGYAVKLREYNCQCGSWQVSEILYCHAMAAISHYCGRVAVKDKVAKFVHSSLTKSAYMQTYISMIHPIPDQKRWPEVLACILIPGHTEHFNPPPRTVQPGRPKKQRKREPNEAPKVGRSGIVICKLCHQAGHNKRSCQRRKDNQTEGVSVGASFSHEPYQTPSPQLQVTQQLFN